MSLHFLISKTVINLHIPQSYFPPLKFVLSSFKSQCVAGGQGDGLCHPSYLWCLDTQYMFYVLNLPFQPGTTQEAALWAWEARET